MPIKRQSHVWRYVCSVSYTRLYTHTHTGPRPLDTWSKLHLPPICLDTIRVPHESASGRFTDPIPCLSLAHTSRSVPTTPDARQYCLSRQADGASSCYSVWIGRECLEDITNSWLWCVLGLPPEHKIYPESVASTRIPVTGNQLSYTSWVDH